MSKRSLHFHDHSSTLYSDHDMESKCAGLQMNEEKVISMGIMKYHSDF